MGSYKNERTRRMEHYDTVELANVGVGGDSGEGTLVEVGARGTLLLDLDVLELGAGTTLTVTLKTSKDGVAWRTLGAFAAAAAPGSERKSFPGSDRYARADWALAGGTTTASFTVTGEAV
jgi:hypothetical protein